MDTASLIGFAMLIIFLIGFIITIWKDTQSEKRFWEERNNRNN